MLFRSGGVTTGWQLVLRSDKIFGPYESRIVMMQGDTDINGPHQGAWIDTNQNESWFVHFQDKGAYGRIIHLNPMSWENDWPIIGKKKAGKQWGEPVSQHTKPNVGMTYPVAAPPENDDFNSRSLGGQWQWHANYQPTFGFTTNMGYIRIYGHMLSEEFVNFWEVSNLLLQKFPAETFTATAKLKISAKADGQQSGLTIMGWDYCYLGVEKLINRVVLRTDRKRVG